MDRHNSQPDQTDSGAERGSTARDCQTRLIVRLEADMPLSGWRIGPAHDREGWEADGLLSEIGTKKADALAKRPKRPLTTQLRTKLGLRMAPKL